jgi:hypothetical protein
MKKINKILLMIAFSAVLFSCSKDDDPAPAKSLEDVSLSLAASGSTAPVEAPAAMAKSTDDHAMIANSYVTSVNAITGYMSYFKAPQGSVKSSTRITAKNGRVAATKTDYLVYTWTDAQNNISVAYQVSEQSGKYVFEIFTKTGNKDWLLYVYAEEKTDGSEGSMKVYNSLFGDGSLLVTYQWKHNGDILDFSMVSDTQGTKAEINISINKKTKAGSMEVIFDDVKLYTMQWDAKGNGSWKVFEEDGTEADKGSWTV